MPLADMEPLYTPISDWQTRILLLRPGDSGDALVADLHVADLIHTDGIALHKQQKRVAYRALSYCWGEPKFDFTIHCNDQPLAITANLHTALQRIRHTDEAQYFWVDAICINQEDTQERSQQVRNMLLIYSKAMEVVVWLGDCPAASQYEIKDMVVQTKERALNKHNTDNDDDDLRVALHELARQPWFGRIWVLQEVWAANSLTIRYGDKTAAWQDLYELGLDSEWAYEPHDYNLTTLIKRFSRSSRKTKALIALEDEANPFLSNSETGSTEMPERDLLTVIRRTSGSQCSDIRDHIYGVLGMSSAKVGTLRIADTDAEGTGPVFRVDYSSEKTLGQTYEDVARYIMSRDRALNVLYLQGKFGSVIAGGEQLPSWVANLRHPYSTLGWIDYSRDLYLRTGGNLTLPCYPHYSELTPGILNVEGFRLAVVKSRSDTALIENGDSPFTSERDIRYWVNCELKRLFADQLDPWSKQSLPGSAFRSLSILLSPTNPDLRAVLWEDELVMSRSTRTVAPLHHTTSFPKINKQNSFAQCAAPHFPASNQFSEVKAQEIKSWYTRSRPYEWWLPKIFVTPPTAQEGDLIVIIRGGLLPIVLRQKVDTALWQFIGPAMIAGIAFQDRHKGEETGGIGHAKMFATRVHEMLESCVKDESLEQFRIS